MAAGPNSQIDPWGKIETALEDERWDFRTVEGIAAETGLDAKVVAEELERHSGRVRRAIAPDRKGRELYTAKRRRAGLREIVGNMQRIASKSF